MNWLTTLTDLKFSHPEETFSIRQELCPPATDDEIAEAERRLKTLFPASLRSLLHTTNGVMRMMTVDGVEWFEDSWTVWPLVEIVQQNQRHRERYADQNVFRFEFFAAAGAGGVQFGFPSTTERVEDAPVFAWYPDETDDKRMAEGLGRFLEEWCCGRLTV